MTEKMKHLTGVYPEHEGHLKGWTRYMSRDLERRFCDFCGEEYKHPGRCCSKEHFQLLQQKIYAGSEK